MSEAIASSASSEGQAYKKCFSLPLQFLKPPGVRHSTFESLRLGRSSQSIAYGFLRFWDSLNFKKDREFVGITIRLLDNLQVIANTNLETGKHTIFGSSKQDYNHANSSGMTYQQLKLPLSWIALSQGLHWQRFLGRKNILLLKKDRDNPVLSF
ncbi:hypothetical protein YC2023_014391 [Brassica napus]